MTSDRNQPAPNPQTRLDALTRSAVDAIVSGDGGGHITDWNPAAERMFGYSAREIVGRTIETLIPLRFREAHRAGIARIARGERGRTLGATKELAAVRKSGEEFPIELSLSTWEHDGERFFTGIIRDISERKRMERTTRRYARELSSTLRHLETLFAMVADLLEGRTLAGRYLLERRTRSDRIGALYEAMDLEHRAPVDVRVIRAPCRPGSLRHRDRSDDAHAETVLDIGISDLGLPFVVTEPLSGERLADRLLRRRRVDRAEALAWCRAIATSLASAHRRGEVHGQLCLESIFLQHADTPAQAVRVTDYELGQLVRAGSAIAEAMAEAQGPFCAPEVRGGAAPTPAADVFAIAVLLGTLVGGTAPPGSASAEQRTTWIRAALPADLGELAPLAEQALAADPAARPAAAELARAAARAQGGYSGPKDQTPDDDHQPRDF